MLSALVRRRGGVHRSARRLCQFSSTCCGCGGLDHPSDLEIGKSCRERRRFEILNPYHECGGFLLLVAGPNRARRWAGRSITTPANIWRISASISRDLPGVRFGTLISRVVGSALRRLWIRGQSTALFLNPRAGRSVHPGHRCSWRQGDRSGVDGTPISFGPRQVMKNSRPIVAVRSGPKAGCLEGNANRTATPALRSSGISATRRPGR